jgi:hypothetical protein
MLLSFWLSVSDCNALDRCNKYRPRVIREARYFVGLDAPHHLFMGQIEQESRCNEGITAFDGGMGLGQFMPATAEWMHERETALKAISVEAMPYSPAWSIRALILYDRYLYGIVSCKGWYYAFRAYNGGAGALNKEIRRAGTCEETLVEQNCRRRIIKMKNGSLLDLGRVNIDYPHQIMRKGEKYR